MQKVAAVLGYTGLLFLLFTSAVWASVSTNVPLDHWSYDDLDRLIGRDLIDSVLMGTRPYSRLEMAHLFGEAMRKVEEKKEENEIVQAIFSRFKREFRDELVFYKHLDGHSPTSFLKPLDALSFRYLHAAENTFIENNDGDELFTGSNNRFIFSTRGKLWDHFGFYIQPEFDLQREEGDWHDNQEIRKIYGKLEFFNLEIEVGRDNLWWGPGRHGALFLTNNAKSYENMIKISNPQPILLPWIFETLGPFQVTLFWAELEEDRHISKAEILGQRINLKPHPLFEMGLSRTYTWGGEEEEETISEFWRIFKSDGDDSGGDYLYMTGVDASIRIPGVDRRIPIMKTLTLYGELGYNDEVGGNQRQRAFLAGGYFGDLFLTGRTDLRVEYSTNKPDGDNFWYTHDHYESGYTFKGRIIGHHMGTNTDDIFVRLTHYITKDWLIDLDFDRELISPSQDALSSYTTQQNDTWSVNLSYLGFDNMRISGIYRYELIKNDGFINGETQENHIGGMDVIYSF